VEQANPGFKTTVSDFWALVARDTDLVGLRIMAEQHKGEVGPTLMSFIEKQWTAEEFTNAYIVRQDVNNKMNRFMEKYDLVLTPTLGVPPFEVGINGPTIIEETEVEDAHWLSFTFPLNMTGQPAATVPAGWTEDGLPIGLQIIGRHLDDTTVLRASAAYEEANPWAHRYPKY
jgi:aspartyl-tRNA(Asn)/glutamyl-tRNA(Gln) amidotransferase subunit A